MTKLFLSSAAALAFALSATVAYAQDADMADPEKTHSEAVMDAAEDTMEAAEDTMEAAEMLEEAEAETDDWGNPLEIDANVDTATQMIDNTESVDCPEGTEAQDDGTCRIVGEYETEEAPEG